MEAYDLSRKLSYAGARSPIPFTTGPEYTNSVPGVPVLSMIRIFVEPEHGTEGDLQTVAREVSRVLGPTEQYDVGITTSGRQAYDPSASASGVTARVMKLDRHDSKVVLRISDGIADKIFVARFPRLEFVQSGEDMWQSAFAPRAVKQTSQP
jgi:hypothetical protein